ncbi:MAG: hypothetical protein SOW48_07445 [Peptoniphilaceae bacterium]|nr:hypothetical protein [Peptoniphilaceae bacterium]MCI6660552.1 hypothetical protein [Peptoniphilaceae bacterium]MDD7434478.1 hypothetical protein [Peptoniphilaceae bacterium]MDY3076465.1 hypothetical protein [Peptoniphilaceae bacterium]MDY4196428.1 hypothetical protein [Peptoniphilaceae bacterium]
MDRNKNHKPVSVLFFLIGVVLFITATGLLIKKHLPSHVFTSQNELVASYHAHLSHIDIYQQNRRIVINAYSDDRFDEPNQIVIDTEEKISKEDISVEWETIGGKPVDQDSMSVSAARVQIKKNNTIVFDGIFNLFEVGWKILDKVIGE